jgi:hypothetical protein
MRRRASVRPAALTAEQLVDAVRAAGFDDLLLPGWRWD